MRNSNIQNNSKLQSDVTIALPGTSGATPIILRVPIRLQGSVFILDRTKNPETLVQLDGFHQASHPLVRVQIIRHARTRCVCKSQSCMFSKQFWAKETYIEAELCDLMRPRALSSVVDRVMTGNTGAFPYNP